MASQESCPSCGGSSIEEDPTHGVIVCLSCGTAVDGVLDTSQPSSAPQTVRFNQHGPSREQIRVFSEKNYSARKLERVVKETRKMAVAMKLPAAKTDICVEQAKELCRRQVVGSRGLSMEIVSAALVYIAWKNENSSISAWDMMNTGVKPNVLLKATSRLCDQNPDLLSVTQEEPVTDEERLGQRLDRFSPVHGDERRRVISTAQQVWDLVLGVKVQDIHLRKIPINDYSILAVALQYIRRKDLPKAEISLLAKNISMTVATVKTRIWLIKKALVMLAARCPCLVEDVKGRVIHTQNVQRYLDRLLQNKDYLSCEIELIREGAVEEEDITGAEKEGEEGSRATTKRRPRKRARKTAPISQPAVYVDSQVGVDKGNDTEEEDNLSDLDDEIDEYILSEEQVKMRKFLLSTNEDNNDSD